MNTNKIFELDILRVKHIKRNKYLIEFDNLSSIPNPILSINKDCLLRLLDNKGFNYLTSIQLGFEVMDALDLLRVQEERPIAAINIIIEEE